MCGHSGIDDTDWVKHCIMTEVDGS